MTKLKIRAVFLGSDKYSNIVYEILAKSDLIEFVAKIHDKSELSDLRNSIKEVPDVAIVASFGGLIPESLLNWPKYGFLNIHPSLLPKYRGPSPAQAAIINGDNETGVTIFKLDNKIDHGPILAQTEEDIRPNDTAESLYNRLFTVGADKLLETLPDYIAGKIKPVAQNEAETIYTKKLTRGDGFIQVAELRRCLYTGLENNHARSVISSEVKRSREIFEPLTSKRSLDYARDDEKATRNNCLTSHGSPATYLNRFIRAMQPWPGAWTLVEIKNQKSKIKKTEAKRLKILKAHLETVTPVVLPDRSYTNDPGSKSKLILDLVQLEGKKPVTFKQFCEGHSNPFESQNDEGT